MGDINDGDKCACGETEWKIGKGWPTLHSLDECSVRGHWVRREVFARTPRAWADAVAKLMEEKAAAEHGASLIQERLNQATETLEETSEECRIWRDAAESLARVVGRRP